MSVTGQQVFNMAMDLLDERNSNGTFSQADIGVYEKRAPSLLTMAQAELLEQGEIFSTHEVTNYPVLNQLGECFSIVEHKDEDVIYIASGSKAYYFEVDAPATVYVEEESGGSWTTLATITDTTATTFTAYSGLITASSTTANIRLRFGGSYYYKIRNIALFEYSFQADRIPVYKPWIPKDMPSDFKSIDRIIEEESEYYIKSGNFKWEGRNKLYVSYDFEGNLRIVYRPVPTVISSLSSNLQLDDVTCIKVLPYYLATHLVLDENPELSGYFNDRMEEMKLECSIKEPEGEIAIKDVYGGLGG